MKKTRDQISYSIDLTKPLPKELKEKANQLYSWQSDDEVRALYGRYKNDPLIRWKGEIKKIVGLPIGNVGSDE